MNLLVLGGGQFVGRHIVDAALKRGHKVWTFSRGQTNADLFPEVQKLIGDRTEGNLVALKGHTWDAVMDVNGYVPRIVRESAELLKGNVGRYLFISTVSVYSDPNRCGEDGPVKILSDPSVEEVTGETYGSLKAFCEDGVREIYGPQASIVRPHLVVGPHDPTGRFTYWPYRAWLGGEMLIPGRPDNPFQFVDARDLGAFVVRLVENHTPGTFNGARPHIQMGELVKALSTATNRAFEPVWVDAAFLEAQQIQPWADLPGWIPASSADAGLSKTPTEKSIAAGLELRPVLETVRDTLQWARTLPEVKTAAITAVREAEVLKAWKEG